MTMNKIKTRIPLSFNLMSTLDDFTCTLRVVKTRSNVQYWVELVAAGWSKRVKRESTVFISRYINKNYKMEDGIKIT